MRLHPALLHALAPSFLGFGVRGWSCSNKFEAGPQLPCWLSMLCGSLGMKRRLLNNRPSGIISKQHVQGFAGLRTEVGGLNFQGAAIGARQSRVGGGESWRTEDRDHAECVHVFLEMELRLLKPDYPALQENSQMLDVSILELASHARA